MWEVAPGAGNPSSYLSGGEICELVLLGVLKPKMTAAVPLGVSKVIAMKKK